MPSRPNAQNSSAMLPPCAFIPFADDIHATFKMNPPPPKMHDPIRNTIPVVILSLSSKFVGYNGIQWTKSSFGINSGYPTFRFVVGDTASRNYHTFLLSVSCLSRPIELSTQKQISLTLVRRRSGCRW